MENDNTDHPLEAWRKLARVSASWVCRELGIKSRTTYYRYIHDERLPDPEMLIEIERLTQHAVTRDDFIGRVAAARKARKAERASAAA
jgi:hypothetical protein